jgi:hypothetical protein
VISISPFQSARIPIPFGGLRPHIEDGVRLLGDEGFEQNAQSRFKLSAG